MVKEEKPVGTRIKEEKPIFLNTIFLIGVFLILEAGVFVWLYLRNNTIGFSGFSIADLTNIYSKSLPGSRIFLYIQWALILIIIFYVYLKNRKIRKRQTEKVGIDLSKIRKKAKTDLDALYIILQNKKRISIKSISGIFKIPEDLAVEWARILETGELVEIDYSGIGSPIVKIKKKEKDEDIPERLNLVKKIDKEVKHEKKEKKKR